MVGPKLEKAFISTVSHTVPAPKSSNVSTFVGILYKTPGRKKSTTCMAVSSLAVL